MSSQNSYKGARFYKCALQVNSYRYAEYRGKTPQDESTYNNQILEQCKTNNIKVVGLADHGKVEDSESLRSLLRGRDITVFPGFEIASSEKIHMVCLYPEETIISKLNQYLGQLMGTNTSELKEASTYPSSLSCEEIASAVLNNQIGFWYAAHMTGTNGLLSLSRTGGNYIHLWRKKDLVVAGQIPGKTDDLDVEQTKLKSYKDIIENKNPDYKRDKPIAIINAKDIEQPETLAHPSASCLIKMTEPNFDAFKQAFMDSESRIRLNHQAPERQYSSIKSIKWQGAGFFEDSDIIFSKHLNTIIGGRGTGKSTIIESIRYALDLPTRKDNNGNKSLEVFRKNILNNSQVILEVYSKTQQGNCYTISRRYGEAPIVKNNQGEVSHLIPRDILPDIELLGQNEILEIEKDEDAKLSLIDNFLPNSDRFNTDMAEIKRRLADNRNKLIKANEELERLDEAISKEDKLKEKVTQFKKLGVEDKLKNAKLIEKEKIIQAKIKEQFDAVEKWTKSYQSIFDLTFLRETDLAELPNESSMVATRKIFEDLQKTLSDLIEQANKELQNAKEKYQEAQSPWQEKAEKIRTDLNEAITQLPGQAGKSGKELGTEYTDIIQQLTLIEKQGQTHKNQKKIVEAIELERTTLLEEYRNTAFNYFKTMDKKVKKLNESDLKDKVKIEVNRCGNVDSLKDFLLDIEGIGESKIQWLNEEKIELDLVEWSQWIKEKNSVAFMEKYQAYGLTRGVADRLISVNISKRLELEEIELKDQVGIKLNTAHENSAPYYIPLDKLSTGQKCTAILNLLLLNPNDPLIIDQPEDNLDNAFIAERIVRDLRKLKINRQFLFASHNANIPVFGDAELIAVLDSKEGKGQIKNIGSIDKLEVSKDAAEILEGGEAAFNMRKNKYGF